MNILTWPFKLIGAAGRGAAKAMFPPVTTKMVLERSIEDATQAMVLHINQMENSTLAAGNHKANADMLKKRIARLTAELAASAKKQNEK